MKRYIFKIIIWLFLITGPVVAFGQPRLAWRHTTPRLINSSGNNYLVFDIEVKADSANIFLGGMTVAMNFNISALSTTSSDITVTKGSQYAGLNSIGNQKYTVTGPVYGSSRFTFGYTSDVSVANNPTTSADFGQILTTWHIYATVQMKIINNTLLAGLNFRLGSGGFATGSFRRLNQVNNPAIAFLTPHMLDTKTMGRLCLGRIYNSVTGWTQYGGTVDWTVANTNTSVWDSVAPYAVTGGLTGKLRIHPHSPAPPSDYVASLPGGRIRLAHGSQLTCSDSTIIEEERGLWLQSTGGGGGGGASFIDNGNIAYNTADASALVEKYLVQDKWHGYCLPLSSTLARASFHQVYMKYWVENTHAYWYVIVSYPFPDSTINGGNNNVRGYFMWATSASGITTVKPVGQLNTGSLNTISLTRGSNENDPGNGYNFIGNPYPSAIDLTTVTWPLDLENVAWCWDPDAGNYMSYPGGYPPSGTHTEYIPAQQGFMVHHVATGTTPTTMTFNNGNRVHNSEPYLKNIQDVSDLLQLKAVSSVNQEFDLANICFLNGTSAGFDLNIDVVKLTGDINAPQLYSLIENNQELSINTMPWSNVTQIIPVGFSCGLSGTFTITAANLSSFRMGTGIFLKDLKLNITQDLNVNPDYSFDYTVGDNAGRFEILFYNPFLGIANHSDENIQIFSFDKNVYVKDLSSKISDGGLITIFDLTGRTVFQDKLKNSALNTFYPGVNEGYYIVRVVTKDNSYNQEVFIR